MKLLREFSVGRFRAEEYDLLGSTNDFLKERASAGESDLAAIAVRQSGGKGRLGRSFYSPKSGLYLSALLRNIPTGSALLLTPAAAVAAARACEDCGAKEIGIKWVNDLYSGGKKVCGILTESQISPAGSELSWAVVGIGINIEEPEEGFPPEIKDRAGAAFQRNFPGLREKLAEALLLRLGEALDGLAEKEFLEEYRARSILIGREVYAGGEKCLVEGIDENCGLVVVTPRGRKTLTAGEVSVRL